MIVSNTFMYSNNGRSKDVTRMRIGNADVGGVNDMNLNSLTKTLCT